MVANVPPTRFTLDPARRAEFIDDISSIDDRYVEIAHKWQTTTGELSLFLVSPEGLELVAQAELAIALRVRLTAASQLRDVVKTLSFVVNEYSAEERRVPLGNTIDRINLLETKRSNARRAGNLLFRLSRYVPSPIRSYTVRPIAADSAPPRGMLKRALGHGATSDIATPPAPAVAASITADVVAPDSAQTCAMPTPPLEQGEADDLSMSATPSVAAPATAFEVAVPLTISACAFHHHLRRCEGSRGLSPCDVPKPPLEHGAALDHQTAATRTDVTNDCFSLAEIAPTIDEHSSPIMVCAGAAGTDLPAMSNAHAPHHDSGP